MRVRLLLAVLVAAALVLPALVAWLGVRAFKGRAPTPRTLEVDLGPVFLDPARPHTWGARQQFEFTNPARDATAHLRVVYNSCGCSAALVERPELPPGERTQILLSMSVPYFRQDRREWAIIDTGLPKYDQLIVSLAASFYPRLAIEAEALPEAGLAPGATHTLLARLGVALAGDTAVASFERWHERACALLPTHPAAQTRCGRHAATAGPDMHMAQLENVSRAATDCEAMSYGNRTLQPQGRGAPNLVMDGSRIRSG